MNQKQTYRQEIAGGYLWSPKRRADNARNQFYENMRIVAPGDLVFSYWNTAIRAYGIVRSFGYDAPKPAEFGTAGRNWAQIGYRADVEYVRMTTIVSPRDAWGDIEALLPDKYSPLREGKGLQSVYLAALPDELGKLLWRLVEEAHNPLVARDSRALLLRSSEEPERELWERHEIERLDDTDLPSTEREAIITARRGQGRFRDGVASIERECRVTRVSNPAYLLASHIKPWRHASNAERLSAHNGLMLAPQADYLFDRGFISFEEGRLLISEVADERSLIRLGIDPDHPPSVGSFDREQERFLDFHRTEIFRSAEDQR